MPWCTAGDAGGRVRKRRERQKERKRGRGREREKEKERVGERTRMNGCWLQASGGGASASATAAGDAMQCRDTAQVPATGDSERAGGEAEDGGQRKDEDAVWWAGSKHPTLPFRGYVTSSGRS